MVVDEIRFMWADARGLGHVRRSTSGDTWLTVSTATAKTEVWPTVQAQDTVQIFRISCLIPAPGARRKHAMRKSLFRVQRGVRNPTE